MWYKGIVGATFLLFFCGEGGWEHNLEVIYHYTNYKAFKTWTNCKNIHVQYSTYSNYDMPILKVYITTPNMHI